MKAVQFHTTGTPDVLHLEDIDRPEPGEGQVRIRVGGSAVNPADGGMRGGTLPIPITLPHIPGYDTTGTIDAVGAGVSFSVGDEVIAFLPMTDNGSAAEYVIAPAEVLVAAPTTIPLADAAALPSVALTAWQALFDEAALEAGQRLLIVGAGGVVGGYAIQLAKRAGAYVIATASSKSREKVIAAGADEVIDHTDAGVLESVKQQVDVLLNLAPISPDEFTALVALVRDGGIVVATTAWMPAPSDDERGVRSSVVFVRSDADQLRQLVALVDNSELTVQVDRRVSLSELQAVHQELADGTLRGKVVVIPNA